MVEDVRTHFRKRTWGWHTLVSLVDIGITAIVVAMAYCFVRYAVFGGVRLPVSGGEVAEIVAAMAWPVAMLLGLLLFRNPILRILNELPGFIRRSYVRYEGKGMMDPDADSKKLNDGISGNVENAKKSKPISAAEIHKKVKAVALRLEKKFGGVAHFDQCIGSRDYIFDVVIETKEKIIGVEIKMGVPNDNVWRLVFERVKYMYDKYDQALKSRFVFVAAIIGQISDAERLKLMDIGQNYDFKAQVLVCDEALFRR